MSSRREVLIRILALLQRKTLIETKNRTLKCLKWHYLTVQSMKMLQCRRRTGHLPSFFIPHSGDLTAQESPAPGICHARQKKTGNGGQPRGGGGAGRRWNRLMHYITATRRQESSPTNRRQPTKFFFLSQGLCSDWVVCIAHCIF